MGPQLEALARARPELQVLRIDIESWSSPVARQHSIQRLPTVWLFDGEREVTRDTRQALQRAQSR
jgi:hypothetical protein